MSAITPLLDTLLHQVLGRQLSLEAHARQPLEPSAVSPVIRDGAADDAMSSADGADSDEASASSDDKFADTISSARARQGVVAEGAPRAASGRPVSAAPLSAAFPASAQLMLSDTARELSARVHQTTQQTLLSELAALAEPKLRDTRSHAPLVTAEPAHAEVARETMPSAFKMPTVAQPSILLPLSDAPPLRDAQISESAARNATSPQLELSPMARQMSLWTEVLSSSDWQTLLGADTQSSLLLPITMTMPTFGEPENAQARKPLDHQRDLLVPRLATAFNTSGLFHEALLMQWARGEVPQALVEQSARQRQQLVNLLPSAPEFGDGVVRHQLQLMAGHPIHFQSELWAGAMMVISFRTEPFATTASDGGGAERRFPAFSEQHRIWTLTLTFELAVLGTVSADLQWNGEHLSVALSAESTSTRILLEQHRHQLETLLNDGREPSRLAITAAT